jgi:starch phosphorylase
VPVVRTFDVVPSLPEPLEKLRDLSYNLWWTWEPGALELFARVDRDLWEEVSHNPVRLLANVSQDRLLKLSGDEGFLAHLDRIANKLDYYVKSGGWFSEAHGRLAGGPIAYFSMEFGLHASVPIYSGGLGVLAGDHLKAASDLGAPLVAVGFYYRNGYFRQYLNSDGWQQEMYPEVTPDTLPVTAVTREDGTPLRVHVALGGRDVAIGVWRVEVGRVTLYLLDTNLSDNHMEDRNLTARLYGGDDETRIRQEKILGIGGLRVLTAVGIEPSVCHMNEGHSAFLGIEWIRTMKERTGKDFDACRQAVSAGSVFTTHTPVPAGNDIFSPELVERYFAEEALALGLPWDEFLALGRIAGSGDDKFSMTVLAIHLSNARNGVSELHGVVARQMWRAAWPGVPIEEIPIGSITNGIHLRTWVGGEMQELFNRYLGSAWSDDSANPASWRRVERIPDTEMWRAHERARETLVTYARNRLRHQLERRGAPKPEIEQAAEVLDPEALTIGFARRFATYKRATLLFRDPERLARILEHPERPVQILFAGKAHPRDDHGKEFIRQIIHLTREAGFQNHVVFLEDYEMELARYLVQGVDVWLNTPRRPHEASGTSGMKVVANGGLHLSVLDGWWAEGYRPDLGWAIGSGEEYRDTEYQDQVEGEALYDVLEHEVVPGFYERGRDGLPREWIDRMKTSLTELCPRFSMDRMVKQYVDESYVTASERFVALTANDLSRAADLSAWLRQMRVEWNSVAVHEVSVDGTDPRPVGENIGVHARVGLGKIKPDEVEVQLYHGRLGTDSTVIDGLSVPMRLAGVAEGEGAYNFTGEIPCETSGRHAFAVRVLPRHGDIVSAHETQLVCWG